MANTETCANCGESISKQGKFWVDFSGYVACNPKPGRVGSELHTPGPTPDPERGEK